MAGSGKAVPGAFRTAMNIRAYRQHILSLFIKWVINHMQLVYFFALDIMYIHFWRCC